MYSSLRLSTISFIIHGLLIYSQDIQNARISLNQIGLTASLNLISTIVYAIRILERQYPRRHDFFSSSYQILYIIVIVARLTHQAGLLSVFHYLHVIFQPLRLIEVIVVLNVLVCTQRTYCTRLRLHSKRSTANSRILIYKKRESGKS